MEGARNLSGEPVLQFALLYWSQYSKMHRNKTVHHNNPICRRAINFYRVSG